MSKIKSLYINELTKLKKRTSILVLLIIMVVVILGYGGITKLLSSVENEVYFMDGVVFEEIVDGYYEDYFNELDKQISEQESLLNQTTDLNEQTTINYNIDSLNVEKKYYELAFENDVDMFTGSDFYVDAITTLIEMEREALDLEYGFISQTSINSEDINNIIVLLEDSINKNDFQIYLQAKTEMTNMDNSLSSEEKEIMLKEFELLSKANPAGEENYILDSKISLIINTKLSILYGVNSQGALLSSDEIEELENLVLVEEYKIENNIDVSNQIYSSSTSFITFASVGITVIMILMIILAGGSFSSELSTGTIKSLIIAPVKRWKIFVAKLLALLTVGIVFLFIAYIVSVICFLVFFGGGEMTPYIYASNGTIHSIPFLVHKLLYLLLLFIPSIAYMLFALLLSVVTKSTAISVGVSIGISIVGDIINVMLNLFAHGRWMDFIPFNNLNIAERVFSDSNLEAYVSSVGMGNLLNNQISVGFSVIYLVVIFIAMGWIALDSFTRKDI